MIHGNIVKVKQNVRAHILIVNLEMCHVQCLDVWPLHRYTHDVCEWCRDICSNYAAKTSKVNFLNGH